MTRLILLDRDGVINYDSPHYIKDVDEWVPIPGAIDAVAALKRGGYMVAVCSNQSGVGRGLLTMPALKGIHAKLHALLRERGVSLDVLDYCPHHPDEGCDCRKPRPGMLIRTMQALGVDPEETLFVGDAIRDVEAALAAGCRPVLVRSAGGAAVEAEARQLGVDWIEDDLAAVARTLLEDDPC